MSPRAHACGTCQARFAAESTQSARSSGRASTTRPQRCRHAKRVGCQVGAGEAIRRREFPAGRARRRTDESACSDGQAENCRRAQSSLAGRIARLKERPTCTSSPHPRPLRRSTWRRPAPMPTHHPTSSPRGFGPGEAAGVASCRLSGRRSPVREDVVRRVGGPTVRRARSTALERDKRGLPSGMTGYAAWQRRYAMVVRRSGVRRRLGRRTVWPCLPLRAGRGGRSATRPVCRGQHFSGYCPIRIHAAATRSTGRWPGSRLPLAAS